MGAKRILILTNRIPYPYNDGGNLAMHSMIEGYRSSGWEVSLLSMNTSRHYIPEDTQEKIYQELYSFDTVGVDNRVKLLSTLANFLFSKTPNHVMRFSSHAFAKKFKERIEAFKPDVIQVESVYLTNYLYELGVGSKAVTVLRLHNIEYQIWERLAEEHRSYLKHYYFKNLAERIKKYEQWAWHQYSLLLPITSVDAAVVKLSRPNAPILTVPFAIERKDKATHASAAIYKGYHIGAMDWVPNQEALNWFLQKIWPEVHRQVPEFEFYFAGRYMPESYQKLQLEGVVCLGEAADADAFISDKKILIVPLRSGGGVRIKILEAMAAGKIVISTDVGMQGIEAIAGIHYLNANDAVGFAEAIKWCIAQEAEADEIGRNAVEFIETSYAREDIMNRLNKRLDELMNNERG